MPDLVGKNQTEAATALRQLKLEGDPRTGSSDNCKAGTVISQNPGRARGERGLPGRLRHLSASPR